MNNPRYGSVSARSLLLICTTVFATYSLLYCNETKAAVVVTKAATVTTNVISPLSTSSAQLQFHEGLVANNQEAIDPVMPLVPGPASPWLLTQWNHDVYIHPTDVTVTPSIYGPNYTFMAKDQEAALMTHQVAGITGKVFNLYNSNGTLTSGGGRALYLTNNETPGAADTADHEIDLSMNVRVTAAVATYNNSTAEWNGAVLAMAYTGLGVLFKDPVTGAMQFIFMQLPLTQSGPSTNTSKYMCNKDIGGTFVTLFAPKVPAANILPFKSEGNAPMHALTYNLSAMVQDMISNPLPCNQSTFPVWTAAQMNLANWHITGIYFGSETENIDLREGATIKGPQGQAALDLDVGSLAIVRH